MPRAGGAIPEILVLLVDDHPVVREGIRRLLELDEAIGVVGEAESAEDALTQLASSPARVVLMDIQLPGVSGIEATRQLKSQHPEVRVIILSAFGDEYLPQAIEAGADGYMLKTATRMELVSAVKGAAAGKSPIDGDLTTGLLHRITEISKLAQVRGLTQRRLAILRQVAQGTPSKEIGAELSISEATVKRNIRGIFDYLGANDRAQAVAEAYKRHLL